MRVAALDIGTNAVLLLVGERSSQGKLQPIAERATITRLGEAVDRTHALSPSAIARTKACLDDYAVLIRALGVERVAVVGTSAMRDAKGGEELRAYALAILGVEIQTLSGDDEARLTFRGGLSGLAVEAFDDTLIFDIGGGSTEVVLGRLDGGQERIAFTESFDVGSVRLTERHVKHDPPTLEERAAISRAAGEAFAQVPVLAAGQIPVGIAGTMTSLAAIYLRLSPYDASQVHGYLMRTRDVASVVDSLAKMDLRSRRELAGLEPQRADIIVAGGCIALALLARANAGVVRISDRGVRWGLAEQLAR